MQSLDLNSRLLCWPCFLSEGETVNEVTQDMISETLRIRICEWRDGVNKQTPTRLSESCRRVYIATCELLLGSCRFGRESRSDNWLQEGHHLAQARTELFDGMLLLGFAFGKEVRAASFVFGDPFFGE